MLLEFDLQSSWLLRGGHLRGRTKKSIVYRHGPGKLREFPGFHDEKLKGNRAGQRSSRLSLQYRVIYAVKEEIVTVLVLEINPHDY